LTRLVERLRSLVGPEGVLTSQDICTRRPLYGYFPPGTALGLVRPGSTAELSRVLAACHAEGQPVCVQGGLTGLVDGASPRDGELIISLERMNRIEGIDTAGRTIAVQAGIPVQALQERAAAEGLLFPVDWGARGSATVGGAIATNAGGNAVLRYGMMREQVLGLEAVLADGTVISSMNGLIKDNSGYDLKQLFIGTEGTLGIVTRAVLRLRAAPVSRNTALIGVASFPQVIELLHALDAGLGGKLSAFEVMWQDHYRMQTRPDGPHAAVLSRDHACYVLAEATGSDPQGDSSLFESLLASGLAQGLIDDASIAASGAQCDALWAMREDIETCVRTLSPLIAFDVSLPLRYIEDYLERMTREVTTAWPGARRIVFGHLGDNNLHIGWSVGDLSPDTRNAISGMVYDGLQPFGGSISAEHGIGLQKRDFLDRTRSPAEISLMQSIKAMMDPRSILNPGRVVRAG
jgi:FAD/FMN-containing dehydrogenase